MRNRTSDKKSPLKDAPLRNPGQSIERHIEQLIERMGTIFLYAVGYLFLTAFEWWRYFSPIDSPPYLVTVISVLLLIYAVSQVIKIRRKLRDLRLGLLGEKAVGQDLEHFREQGARVFHDLQGDGFNIDHVVVAQQGIFVVETKT